MLTVISEVDFVWWWEGSYYLSSTVVAKEISKWNLFLVRCLWGNLSVTFLSRQQYFQYDPFHSLPLYPNITFRCNGSIVGWSLAAVNDTRSGRPELSVWRSNGTNQYIKVAASLINPSVISDNVGQLGTGTVMIHENTIRRPIPFEPGDILGILFRRRPRYVPLLYNITSSGNCEGLVSFYRQTRRSPPDDDIVLTSDINRDSLFPLISLQICKFCIRNEIFQGFGVSVIEFI